MSQTPFFIVTNTYSTLLHGDEDRKIDVFPGCPRKGNLPRTIAVDVLKNASLMDRIEKSTRRGEGRIALPNDYPLAYADPMRIDLNGYDRPRLFIVEPIGDHFVIDGLLVANTLRVMSESSPALLFGSNTLYERVVCVREKTQSLNQGLVDTIAWFDLYTPLADHLDESMISEARRITLRENPIAAIQIFHYMIFQKTVHHRPARIAMRNAASLAPASLAPYMAMLVYGELIKTDPSLKNSTFDAIRAIVNNAVVHHFGKLL